MQDQVSRFFKRQDWCGPVFKFLTLGELMTTATVSKTFFSSVSLQLGTMLEEEGISLQGVEPDSYLKLFREVHFKSVIILQMDTLNLKDKVDVFSQAKITKKTLGSSLQATTSRARNSA